MTTTLDALTRGRTATARKAEALEKRLHLLTSPMQRYARTRDERLEYEFARAEVLELRAVSADLYALEGEELKRRGLDVCTCDNC